MTKMIKVCGEFNFDLTEWMDGQIDEDGLHVNERVRELFKEEPPYAELPYVWWPEDDGSNNAAVADPVMLYVHLPSVDLGEGPTYALSLEAIVDYYIESCVNDDLIREPPEIEKAKRLAARLRQLANKLEQACAG